MDTTTKKIDKVAEHKATCAELTTTYARKNADYGDSIDLSIDEWGLVAILSRMDDKMRRIKRLTKNTTYEAQVKDESLEDSLLDLANYAIICANYIRRDKK